MWLAFGSHLSYHWRTAFGTWLSAGALAHGSQRVDQGLGACSNGGHAARRRAAQRLSQPHRQPCGVQASSPRRCGRLSALQIRAAARHGSLPGKQGVPWRLCTVRRACRQVPAAQARGLMQRGQPAPQPTALTCASLAQLSPAQRFRAGPGWVAVRLAAHSMPSGASLSTTSLPALRPVLAWQRTACPVAHHAPQQASRLSGLSWPGSMAAANPQRRHCGAAPGATPGNRFQCTWVCAFQRVRFLPALQCLPRHRGGGLGLKAHQRGII